MFDGLYIDFLVMGCSPILGSQFAKDAEVDKPGAWTLGCTTVNGAEIYRDIGGVNNSLFVSH